MLRRLLIRDLLLIEKLDLSFADGLTVLSGETGAGKSILLDGLGLALGGRSGSDMVRSGAREASVEAVFDLPENHEVLRFLSELGLTAPAPGEGLTLRRCLTSEGRSRAYVDRQPVNISTLKKIGDSLLEIQGQHAQVGLTNPSTHLALLDNFARHPDLPEAVQTSWRDWKKARSDLKEAFAEIETARREEEYLQDAVTRLDALRPVAGEENELASLRQTLIAEEKRLEMVGSALGELQPRDRRNRGPAHAIKLAVRELTRFSAAPAKAEENHDPGETAGIIDETLDRLSKAEDALGEAETLLEQLLQRSSFDQKLLEDTEERLFALRAEARRHGIGAEDLPDFLENLRSRLEKLKISEQHIARLEKEVTDAETRYRRAAADLSAARSKAGKELEKAMLEQLRPLKLENAQFIVSLQPFAQGEERETGLENVQFLIAPNPGHPPAPLGKGASGGELSRILLALRVVLAQGSSLQTLIFDEIDSGMGGATASAIGERLKKIGRHAQVFAITHSPQVAAQGTAHFYINKFLRGDLTMTEVRKLADSERREEIARMLAGSHITEAARTAADALLEAARLS